MSDYLELTPGLTGQARATVTPDRTARALGTGAVDVYSSAALVALLEAAAVAALADRLPDGQTTVGTHLGVRHLAPTPVGVAVRAEATLREVDGRRLTFDVEAWDAVERIAAGTHERFIVDRDRFTARAAAKERRAAPDASG